MTEAEQPMPRTSHAAFESQSGLGAVPSANCAGESWKSIEKDESGFLIVPPSP